MKYLPHRENWFRYSLGLSALFVATMAALFSVLGIGMLFSGAIISTMLMASSLEIGKIFATSFLYRYWHKTSTFLKVYLCAAVAVLVLITSLGVFGWLSSAYQSSAMQHELNQQQVLVLVEQKGTISKQADMSRMRIESLMKLRNEQEGRLNEALNNPILSRNPTGLRQVQEQNMVLIKQTDADITTERENYNKFVAEGMNIDKRILDTKLNNNKTKDVITFQFVADAFGMELNTTVKWFIVIIIAVFDPLAVCLILAYNVTLFSGKKEDTIVAPPQNKVPKKEEPTPMLSVPLILSEEPKKILLNEVPVKIDSPVQTVVEQSTPVETLRHNDILHTPGGPEPVRK